MLPPDILILFVAASTMLAVAPGPDNLYVLSQSALHGWRTGVAITLGLCTGLVVHVAAVALGIAAVLKTSALMFTALKLLGAAYLLYLAWQAFRAGGAQLTIERQPRQALAALYLRGIVMNVTNPKVAIFFLAFLPQFVDPARGPAGWQLLALGGVFMLTALVIFCSIAWGAARLGGWLHRSPRAVVAINRLTGGIFVLLAGRLLLTEN